MIDIRRPHRLFEVFDWESGRDPLNTTKPRGDQLELLSTAHQNTVTSFQLVHNDFLRLSFLFQSLPLSTGRLVVGKRRSRVPVQTHIAPSALTSNYPRLKSSLKSLYCEIYRSKSASCDDRPKMYYQIASLFMSKL